MLFGGLQGLMDHLEHDRHLKGLGDKIEGPLADGLDGHIVGTKGGHDDHRRAVFPGLEGGEAFHAAHPR